MKIKKWEVDVNHGSFFFCPYGKGPEPPIRNIKTCRDFNFKAKTHRKANGERHPSEPDPEVWVCV